MYVCLPCFLHTTEQNCYVSTLFSLHTDNAITHPSQSRYKCERIFKIITIYVRCCAGSIVPSYLNVSFPFWSCRTAIITEGRQRERKVCKAYAGLCKKCSQASKFLSWNIVSERELHNDSPLPILGSCCFSIQCQSILLLLQHIFFYFLHSLLLLLLLL